MNYTYMFLSSSVIFNKIFFLSKKKNFTRSTKTKWRQVQILLIQQSKQKKYKTKLVQSYQKIEIENQ